MRSVLLICICIYICICAALCACDESQDRDGQPDMGIDGPLPDAPPFSFPEAGDLPGPEMDPDRDDRCVGAKPVSLSTGKATVQGSTEGAFNEFGDRIRCGEGEALIGPQRYFRLTLDEGTAYRLEITPQFSAYAYLFSECSQALINVDCASDGVSGDLWGPLSANSTHTLFFTPPATGLYWLAIDSLSEDQAGPFGFSVEAVSQVDHDTCSEAKPLTLSAGKVVVQDTTLGALDEFDKAISCNLGYALDGPQVYYTVQLSGGTWYRFDLTPQFLAGLYVANTAGACSAVNIDLDCGGNTGTVLFPVAAGSTGMTAFSPPVTGTYLVVVDSVGKQQAGAFELKILTMVPPPTMTCGTAETLLWGSGTNLVISVSGSTSSFLNDLGAHVDCISGSPLLGPQAYYRVPMGMDKTYRLQLEPDFPAVLAVGSSCLTLPVDCGSAGLNGTMLSVATGAIGSILFTPHTTGNYILAVDGTLGSASGSFHLQLEEYNLPTNGSCKQPKPLTLTTSPLVEPGNTGVLANDLTGVDCGNPAGPWPGPQAYYLVSLTGGVTYTVTVEPEASFDAALYAFVASAACSASGLNIGCQGLSSDQMGAGIPESVILAPTVDTDYILAVDSWSPSDVGSFSLSVAW